jgi:hypothetical protein
LTVALTGGGRLGSCELVPPSVVDKNAAAFLRLDPSSGVEG